MTGATLVDEEFNLKLEDVEFKHFGSAKRIHVSADFTQIVAGSFKQEELDRRIEEIKTTIEQEESKHLKGVHRERLARMQHKIGEIQVGGGTDAERGEEHDLIIDSLNSAKSAMRYGVLPGGGVALYQASKILAEQVASGLIEDPNELVAARILRESLQMPIKLVIENKIGESSAQILSQIEAEGSLFFGFDAKDEKLCDMMETGIVDSL